MLCYSQEGVESRQVLRIGRPRNTMLRIKPFYCLYKRHRPLSTKTKSDKLHRKTFIWPLPSGQPLPALLSFLRRNIRWVEPHWLPPCSNNLRRRRKRDRNRHAASSFGRDVVSQRILRKLIVRKSHQQRRPRKTPF